MIMMSAQETVAGQAFSNASLMLSITSNDLREPMFESESFSPNSVGVSSNNTEPSHPYKTHNIRLYDSKDDFFKNLMY